MSQKKKTLLISLVIGIVLGCCISTPISSIVWFNNNPSMSELRSGITENMSVTEQELNRITQLAMVGAVIDFVLQLMLYAIPVAFAGGILGILGGFFRIRRKQKSAETEVDPRRKAG